MTRRLKALGLALAALAAIGVAGAQGASATVVEHSFASASGTTIIKGTDEPGTNFVWTVAGVATVECEVVHFEGTQVGSNIDEWTLFMTKTECSFFEEEASVTSTGCSLVLDSDTVNRHADMAIECTPTGTWVETGACSIAFGPQTTKPGITYTNIANGDVTVKFTVPDMEAHAWEGPLCFLLEAEGTITADLDGEAILAGFTHGGASTNIAITTP